MTGVDIEKQGETMKTLRQNDVRTVPNSAETVPNHSRMVPNSSRIVPNCSRTFPAVPKQCLIKILGIGGILQGEHEGLGEAQADERADDDKGRPEHDMQPVGWRVDDFGGGGEDGGKRADNDNAEKGRAIALLAGGDMQVAVGAMAMHGKQPAKHRCPTARRTPPEKRRTLKAWAFLHQ